MKGKSLLFAVLLGFALAAVPPSGAQPRDPLPSWNDGAAKLAIMRFVAEVTDKNSKSFVPVAERIAAFDNDGTLWAEKPRYFQLFFVIDRVKALAPQHPEWQSQEPFASILNNDNAMEWLVQVNDAVLVCPLVLRKQPSARIWGMM